MTSVINVNEKDWLELQTKVQKKKIAEAFRLFESENIEPILIKGWAVARLYPSGQMRPVGDIDLCVEPKFFQKAQNLLETEEFKRLNIDLHCGLRHLDTVEWDDLFVNSRLIDIENQKVRVLRPEDHLRVLCVHWLTDGGANKDKLWDIYYTFRNDLEHFDWDRCLQTVSETRRRWIICTIGLAEKYLPAVSSVGTPFEFEKIEIPAWLIKAVEKEWASGLYLKPLQMCLHDRKEFFRQIRKRFPPNPLQATVETEGSFDKKTRIFYQIENIFRRAFPSFRRITAVLKRGKTG